MTATLRSEVVTAERRDGVSTVSLSRPDRANALDEELIAALPRLLAAEAAADDVRVVVLTGAGRHFCSGGDLDHPVFVTSDPARRLELIVDAYRITETILDLPVPVVAAVNGACAGAAVAMVTAADISLAAEDARFSLDFVRLGLLPDMGICHLLPAQIGSAATMELALLGEPISGPEAARLGLVSRTVPAEELLAEAHRIAARIAAHPPDAIHAVRREVRRLPQLPRSEAFAREAATMSELIGQRLAHHAPGGR